MKSRPVDALFGDEHAPALPNYVVEAAPPTTTVAPPPPDAPASTPSDEAMTTPPPPPTLEPETASFEPLAAQEPRPGLDRFAPLAERIERLYGEVKMDLRDSQTATEYCFDWLRQARQAVEARDYARAEYCIQLVDAKLKRSQRSMKAARGIGIIFLWVWELLALIGGGGLVALTYITNLTLFGLPVAADFIVLARAVGWGILGSVSGALYNLPRAVQLREYDAAYAMHYFARPFTGALLGALLFLLSQAGILAGTLVIGDVKIGPLFLYVFAFLVGLKQEYVGEFLDGVLRAALPAPKKKDMR
jgi:hypothetical protein